MDIVSRLKLFLQENGISNSIFADNCGIPRPTLSQLLNGRNKKVSDELIAKIHASYPSLNVMWLMFGDGEMFVPNANNSLSSHSAQPGENSMEYNSSAVDAQNPVRHTTINFANPDQNEYRDTQRVASPASPQVAMADIMLQNMARGASKASQQRNAPQAAGERRVVSIMVLYSDGRFENFVPQGNI